MSSKLTHAGVVAFRREGGQVRYLVVRSKDGRHWVLPKGHIEDGDRDPAAAALRELEEEAGVTGQVIRELSSQEFEKPGERVRVGYFLVEFRADTSPQDNREVAWLAEDDARMRLSFDDAGQMVAEAAKVVADGNK